MQKRSDAEFELVDIKDFDLPLLDEPVSPIMGQYIHRHTNWVSHLPEGQGGLMPTREAEAEWQGNLV
jgi:hypothetical protein